MAAEGDLLLAGPERPDLCLGQSLILDPEARPKLTWRCPACSEMEFAGLCPPRPGHSPPPAAAAQARQASCACPALALALFASPGFRTCLLSPQSACQLSFLPFSPFPAPSPLAPVGSRCGLLPSLAPTTPHAPPGLHPQSVPSPGGGGPCPSCWYLKSSTLRGPAPREPASRPVHPHPPRPHPDATREPRLTLPPPPPLSPFKSIHFLNLKGS